MAGKKQTYFRIHDTSKNDPEDLLDPKNQVSRVWVGSVSRRCEICNGQGALYTWDGDEELVEYCPANCQGGIRWIEEQRGVSVTRSLADLKSYLSDRGWRADKDTVLVELEGEELDEEDVDAAYGALLIRPTRIVKVRKVPKELLALESRMENPSNQRLKARLMRY